MLLKPGDFVRVVNPDHRKFYKYGYVTRLVLGGIEVEIGGRGNPSACFFFRDELELIESSQEMSAQGKLIQDFKSGKITLSEIPRESCCRKCCRPHLPYKPLCELCEEIAMDAYWNAPPAPKKLMTREQIEACRNIGRDEVTRTSTIGLAELDALCDTALAAVEQLEKETG